jgi:Sugar (and other) transporter
MIVQITPISINSIGWRTYIIFAVLNACWVPIIFFLFPETKGLELEAVDALFSGDAPMEPLESGKGEGETILQVEHVAGERQA